MKSNFYVEVTLTNNCNCNCSYCFEGLHSCERRNLLEEQRQISILLNSIAEFDKDKYDKFIISFWGGEPFMNVEYMYDIILKTYKYDFVYYNYFSNGTLTDKYEDFLLQDFIDSIRARIHIQLSFDGLSIHEKKRGNNVDKIIKTADLLRANNIRFDFKATLPFDMIDKLQTVWDSYYWLFLRYGDNVAYSPTLDTCCIDLNLLDLQLDEFNKQMLEICKKEYVFYRKYGRFLTSILDGHKRNCDINNSIFMHNDGNVYYCHGCPYVKSNSNLKICSTKDINTLFDAKTCKIDITEFDDECINCSATYCAICHITLLNEDDDPIDCWTKCRKKNNKLCKYYKAFGRLNMLLNYALKY